MRREESTALALRPHNEAAFSQWLAVDVDGGAADLLGVPVPLQVGAC